MIDFILNALKTSTTLSTSSFNLELVIILLSDANLNKLQLRNAII